MADKKTDNRSAAQIKADIAAARARMTANVEGLVTEVHPKAVKQRSVDEAKAFAMGEVSHLKSQIKDDDGWRTDRLSVAGVAAGAAALGLAVVRAVVKSARNRSRTKAAVKEAKALALQVRKETSAQQKVLAKEASRQRKIAAKQVKKAAKR